MRWKLEVGLNITGDGRAWPAVFYLVSLHVMTE